MRGCSGQPVGPMCGPPWHRPVRRHSCRPASPAAASPTSRTPRSAQPKINRGAARYAPRPRPRMVHPSTIASVTPTPPTASAPTARRPCRPSTAPATTATPRPTTPPPPTGSSGWAATRPPRPRADGSARRTRPSPTTSAGTNWLCPADRAAHGTPRRGEHRLTACRACPATGADLPWRVSAHRTLPVEGQLRDGSRISRIHSQTDRLTPKPSRTATSLLDARRMPPAVQPRSTRKPAGGSRPCRAQGQFHEAGSACGCQPTGRYASPVGQLGADARAMARVTAF